MPKLVPGYRDEVKERILDVAWEVLLDKGVQESTMDDFAKALNCSKGAIYNYFRNKEELLEETIRAGRLQFQEQINKRFSDGDFFKNAEEYFDNEIVNSAGRMERTLGMYLEGTRNEKVKEAMKSKYDSAVESLVELLNRLSDSGRVKLRTDVTTVARSIYTLRTGVVMSLISGAPLKDAKTIWIGGLRAIISEPQ